MKPIAYLQNLLAALTGREARQFVLQVQSSEIGQPQSIPTQSLDNYEAFEKIATAFRGVKVIADTAAQLPINVIRRRKGSDEVIADHPLSTMLHPTYGIANPNATGFDLWSSVFSYQNLVGNAYLLKDRVSRGQPLELANLRPDWMRVVPGRDTPVDHYEYGEGDRKGQRLDPEEVIPFPFWSPRHPFIGQSPLLPVRGTMILELYMVALNTAFFKNGATLGGIITFEKGQQESVVKAMMERFRAQHQGADKAYGWRGLSGVQEVTELGLGNKDLQYFEGMKWSRENIATALGVPMILLGVLDGATFANSKEQKAIFYESTIGPLTKIRDARLNLHLVPQYGTDLYVQTDFSNVDALLPEMGLTVTAANAALRNDAITFGEYRQWIKTRRTPTLVPSERDDLFFSDVVQSPAPFSGGSDLAGAAASGAASGAASAASAPRRAPRRHQTAEEVLAEVTARAEERRLREWREAKSKKEAAFNARVDKASPKMEKVVKAMFDRQESHLKANAGALGPNDLHKVDDLLAALRTENVDAWREGVKGVVESLGKACVKDLGVGDLTFNAVSERVLKYVARTAAQKVQLVDQTTAKAVRESIKKALLEAQIAGENIVDTSSRIIAAGIENGMEIRRERAVKIAQTETTGAYNFSDIEAYRQSGVVEKKAWQTQGDGKVRESHAELDGKEVDLDQPFEVGNVMMDHPGDPSVDAPEEVIECRCYMLPVMTRGFRALRLREQLAALKASETHTNGNGKGAH